MSRPKEWTPQMDAFLRNNADKGSAAIGAALGRSPQAVRKRASRLDVSLFTPRRGKGAAHRPCGPVRATVPVVRGLLALREQDPRSDGDICERAGVGENAIGLLRRGAVTSPGLATFEALAGALGYRLALVREGAQ